MSAMKPIPIKSSCCGCTKTICTNGFQVNRRRFMAGVGTLAGGLTLSTLGASAAESKVGEHRLPEAKTLRVQPVLIYGIPRSRPQTSWRGWGAVQTEKDVADEKNRIGKELEDLKKKAEFALEILPLAAIQSGNEAEPIAKGDHDVLLMYASSGGLDALEKLTTPDKWTIMFVRHRSGPVYLWYEIAHNRYLRKTVDDYGQPNMDCQDVVVDDYGDILWRLRALYGLKNTLGKRIVALGNPSGWGAGGQKAPELAQKRFKLDYVNASYDDLGARIKKARANDRLVKYCSQLADDYLKQDRVEMATSKEFLANAFVLTEVIKDLLDEAQTDAFTINSCMGTVMPISETTACMPLSFLNDEGYQAYCESDFVVIPSGILLHHISNKPVFLNDPTYPHHGVVTLAHCTAPRKMDGQNFEPVKVLTHFESDYGAAPKVEMKVGQKITVIDPDFNFEKWVGFEGEIEGNPFLDICRSQIDVAIKGDCDKLVEETKGFHWMACYGDYLKESQYALKKVGIDWLKIV